MAENKEPVIITVKGELNQRAWTKWYVANFGGTALNAHRQFNEKAACLPEPKITTSLGTPSLRWIRWYAIRKKVSMNVARNACMRHIESIRAGKTPADQQVVWW